MHCGGHQRRKTILVSEIDNGACLYEALRGVPILLGRCNQQRCSALGIMPVRIDVSDQAQFDERIALNRDSANKFAR